jgi:hypothetical protein
MGRTRGAPVHAFCYEAIEIDEIGGPDLRAAARELADPRAYRITVYLTIEQQIEDLDPAFALLDATTGRMGIAWHGSVTWAQVGDLPLDRAIGLWLNLRDEWNRRG